MGTPTTGFHRVNNVTQRALYSTFQQVVPGATIYVTLTSTGSGAVIYSDPALSIVIEGSLITADPYGFYDYYIPLNYNVTETITSVSGLEIVVTNIVQNTGGENQNFVTNEVVDGTGTAFTLANVPVAGSQAIYNGAARLWPTVDYTISGADITMNYSLATGALLADYRY
jgi:hypothetical protein